MVHGSSYTAGYMDGLAKGEEVARAYAHSRPGLRERAKAATSIAHNLKIKREKLERDSDSIHP